MKGSDQMNNKITRESWELIAENIVHKCKWCTKKRWCELRDGVADDDSYCEYYVEGQKWSSPEEMFSERK